MIWLDIVSISNLDRNVTIFLFVYRNHTTSPHHTRPPRSIEQNKVRFKCCYELVIFVRSNTAHGGRKLKEICYLLEIPADNVIFWHAREVTASCVV